MRTLVGTGLGPGAALGRLDGLIKNQNPAFATASLFVGLLDTRTGLLRYASAGHEPPRLARVNGAEEALDATGPVLGVGLDLPYGESIVTLGLGDALLLMTAGVTEARSRQGQFLESDGVWWLLRPVLSAATAQEAVTTLDASLSSFIGSNSRDDIAMLLLRRVSMLAEDSQVWHRHSALLGRENQDREAVQALAA